MKTFEEAESLATEMVNIGKNLGKNTIAVITDMNQPLGYEIGNANEIKEAAEVLQGKKVTDLREIGLELATQMTLLAGKFQNYDEAREKLETNLENGKAFASFRTLIEAQGGDVSMVDDLSKLPSSEYHIEIKADKDGYIQEIEAESVGIAAMHLGAGRATKDDLIDHSVGITLRKKIGDEVKEGDIIAILHANEENPEDSINHLTKAYTIGVEVPVRQPLIRKVIK